MVQSWLFRVIRVFRDHDRPMLNRDVYRVQLNLLYTMHAMNP